GIERAARFDLLDAPASHGNAEPLPHEVDTGPGDLEADGREAGLVEQIRQAARRAPDLEHRRSRSHVLEDSAEVVSRAVGPVGPRSLRGPRHAQDVGDVLLPVLPAVETRLAVWRAVVVGRVGPVVGKRAAAVAASVVLAEGLTRGFPAPAGTRGWAHRSRGGI